jgi:hypothetical protein
LKLDGDNAMMPTETQREFYREFLMGRKKIDPSKYGVSVQPEEFTDQMVNTFNDTYRGYWTVDELLLHPREASRFCDEVRRHFGYYDVPDDIILRVIMNRRKNPD